MDIYLIAKMLVALGTIGGAMIWLYNKVVIPVVGWFKKMLGLIESIEKEFKPNGGSSIRDAINRIELRQLMQEQVQHALDQDALKGIWEADSKGKCIRVNRTYQHLTGLSNEACMGFGWINAVHKDDREDLLKEWEQAVTQQREFYSEHRVVRAGKSVKVILKAYPLKSGEVLHGYAGVIAEEGEHADAVFFDKD